MADSALFIVGASGVGKTAALEQIAGADDFLGVCRFFDSIGVPSAEEMTRRFGSGTGWQASATVEWVRRIEEESACMVILEGQTRPSFIRTAATEHGLAAYGIVLLDCRTDVRADRLRHERRQPELVSKDMERWAAYLRGQADALQIPVIDTSDLSLAEVAGRIRDQALQLHPECFLPSASS